MYVTNGLSKTVSVIDTRTNTVIDTIPVGEGPVDIAFNPYNGGMYVTNGLSKTVSVIDTRTNTVIDTIRTYVSITNTNEEVGAQIHEEILHKVHEINPENNLTQSLDASQPSQEVELPSTKEPEYNNSQEVPYIPEITRQTS
jgi:YVTN family beta-propeller protein